MTSNVKPFPSSAGAPTFGDDGEEMEDDAGLRIIALDMALKGMGLIGGGYAHPDDVEADTIKTATAFYKFIIGETDKE